jgi:hypothetical protein
LPKPSKRNAPRAKGAEPVYAVTVEPLPGHTDAEVVARLRASGVTDVQVMAPGFVSARATRRSMRAVADIADVQVKATKQPR